MPSFSCSVLAYVLFVMFHSNPLVLRQQSVERVGHKPVESTVGCIDLPYAKALPPPGPACGKELFTRRGRPFMFPAQKGIAYGVSLDTTKPSKLYLWEDNQTGADIDAYACCISTVFEHIELFDSEGYRVLSKADQLVQNAHSKGEETVQQCSCSASFTI